MIQPENSSPQSRVIRASLSTYLQYARRAALPFLAIGLYGVVQLANHPRAAGLLSVLGLVVVPIYVAVFIHLELSRVGWDDRRLWKSGLMGMKTINRTDIEGIAFRSVSPAMSIQSVDKLVVYGSGKHILLVLWGAFWSSDDLRTLAIAISPTPADTIVRSVSQRDFNREFPTGGSVIGRHPNISGIVGALLIILVICLGIAATGQ